MQSTMRIIVSMALLASALASAYHNSAKLRRDGVMNLFPFPRVGRASRNSWQLPLDDMYLDYGEPSMEKRQLYAFPRVGRSELSQSRGVNEYQPIRMRRTDGPAMWFGPRLGRSYKRILQDDEITIPNEVSNHSDPEQMEVSNEERKKRNTHN